MTQGAPVKLSVIVPVYNEARTIREILERVRAVPIDMEIIVVDGGSTDGTRELLAEEARRERTRVIYEPAPRGRGRAIKEGLAVARGEIVIFQDADLELDPADYPALIEPLEAERCEVVFGSRFLSGRPKMTFLQYWGNRVINIAVNFFFRTKLTDVETCYQVFRLAAVRDMPLENNHFAFTVELAVKLIKRGNRIVEIPIYYEPRGKAEGKKIYWADGFASLWVILKYRFLRD